MASVIKRPDSLSLSGNMNPFVVFGSGSLSFVLKQGDNALLQQSYEYGADGFVTIDVKEVVTSCLSFSLNAGESSYMQPAIVRDFTAEIDGTSYPFKVLRAGVANLADTATNWLKLHFLTWQPRVKQVTYYTPEWLTYYAVSASEIKLKATFPDKSEKQITLASCLAGSALTVNMQYAVIAGLLGQDYPSFYEVWVESKGVKVSESLFYSYDTARSDDEQWFLFENSLGGVDSFRAYGVNSLNADHEHQIAEMGDVKQEFRIDTERNYTKNTGYLDDYQRRWLLDFFPSRAKYVYEGGSIRKIVVSEDSVTSKSSDLPSFYTFTYQYADVCAYLNLQRNEDDIPSSIVVPDIASPDFLLPPRLVEYPRILLNEGVLLPAFEPHSENPGTVTVGHLKESILNAAIAFIEDILKDVGSDTSSGGSGDVKIVKEKDLTPATDENVFSALRVLYEFSKARTASDGRYIRKDIPDAAQKAITFLEGLQIGPNFVPGLAGFGGYISPDAKAELKALTLRDWLEVPELRFNRTEIVIGDAWRAPGAGIIETVDTVNKIITLKLEDGEIGAVAVDDICRGIFHSSVNSENATEDYDDGVGNVRFAGFYTCFFRITEILETGQNSKFRYEHRPVSANYPRQFHPAPQMHFACYGNFSKKDRQTSNYSTRTYTRYLQGVNTWEFNANNIAMQSGDLNNLSLFGLNMSGYSSFFNNAYVSGVIQQFENKALEMDVRSSMGENLAPGETTYLTARVFNGYGEDVTDTMETWEWTRDTGDALDDEAWRVKMKNVREVCTIVFDKGDLGRNELTNEPTIFTVTASKEFKKVVGEFKL